MHCWAWDSDRCDQDVHPGMVQPDSAHPLPTNCAALAAAPRGGRGRDRTPRELDERYGFCRESLGSDGRDRGRWRRPCVDLVSRPGSDAEGWCSAEKADHCSAAWCVGRGAPSRAHREEAAGGVEGRSSVPAPGVSTVDSDRLGSSGCSGGRGAAAAGSRDRASPRRKIPLKRSKTKAKPGTPENKLGGGPRRRP